MSFFVIINKCSNIWNTRAENECSHWSDSSLVQRSALKIRLRIDEGSINTYQVSLFRFHLYIFSISLFIIYAAPILNKDIGLSSCRTIDTHSVVKNTLDLDPRRMQCVMTLSYMCICKFWIHWVGVNTKLTIWKRFQKSSRNFYNLSASSCALKNMSQWFFLQDVGA